MGRKALWCGVVVLLAVAVVMRCRQETAYGGSWSVPVRVHVLRSHTLPAANCQLSRNDVEQIFARANQIWAPAKINFDIESVVEEEAANASPALLEGDQISAAHVQELRPVASLTTNLIHVYYIHRLTSNGLFQGLNAIFVQDTAELAPVPGGIDTPLPRVTAHELGHALGLPHRQAVTNLMASGTSGLALNDQEILTARQTAAAFPFARKSSPK